MEINSKSVFDDDGHDHDDRMPDKMRAYDIKEGTKGQAKTQTSHEQVKHKEVIA